MTDYKSISVNITDFQPQPVIFWEQPFVSVQHFFPNWLTVEPMLTEYVDKLGSIFNTDIKIMGGPEFKDWLRYNLGL